ncbi:MAG: HU family DNA-binding protein [Bacillota bacterium]
MNQRRARLFYRLSLLMILMSFLSFVVLIASLFVLNLQGAFNCHAPNALGACTLRDRYQDYQILIIGSIALIIVFIILASYFQQFFLVKKPKEKKERVKKAKNIFSKDQNLAVFEVESEATHSVSVATEGSQKPLRKRRKKAKPQLTEYAINKTTRDDDLEAIKQSVYNLPDKPLKLPKDLQELADDDSDYLESETKPSDHELKASDEKVPDKKKTNKDRPEASPQSEAIKTESTSQTKARVLAKDDAAPQKKTPSKPKKHTSIDEETTRKRRTKAHTKEDLSLIVAKRVNMTNDQARHIIDITFDTIKDALTHHDKVNILKFGTFTTKELKARTMQVPSKDEAETTIPAHHVVRFKSSPAFDTFINEEDSEPPIDFEHISTPPKMDTTQTPIKKTALIEAISNQTGLPLSDVKTLMKAFLSTTQDTLSNKDAFALPV